QRLKAARGTPDMPSPDEVASRILALMDDLKDRPSGAFIDIRDLEVDGVVEAVGDPVFGAGVALADVGTRFHVDDAEGDIPAADKTKFCIKKSLAK
ncbi:MAG: hypothetical protein R6V56_04780, partial [Lentisphaeria bacterium]